MKALSSDRVYFFVLFEKRVAYNRVMLDFLPERIQTAVQKINAKYLYELRFRANKPLTINYGGKYVYLGEYGIEKKSERAIIVNEEEIEITVFTAGKFSVYSVEEQIKKGFITAEQGERIGLAGEFVFEKGQALTTKNFTSLCIRVPHEIIGAGQQIYDTCFQGGIKNTLICSPPGQGKTTVLRDLCRLISKKHFKNVLVCDERGEIAIGDLGETVDVYVYADKQTAFDAGIRAMRPDVLVCDELSISDLSAVKRGIDGGVKVLASAHIEKVENLNVEMQKLFDTFVFLSKDEIGKVVGVYDKNLKRLGKDYG